jgi:glycine/D-amino acid oxidase-like deaminating enzyme
MGTRQSDIVICGAGIAGVAAAYYLTVKQGVRNLLLVDERRPLTLTSDKSTEAYRNWWPGPDDAMLRFMNRSIDLLEELADSSDNVFHLNRRGYLYATADPDRAVQFRRTAQQAERMGAGPLRVHDGQSGTAQYRPAPGHGYKDQPIGADLLLDRSLIRQHYPYLADDIIALLHARRCGWFSGQQLGMYLLDQARQHGATLISGRVTGVDVVQNRVAGVRVAQEGGEITVATRAFVNAAGPLLRPVGQMLGVDLPVFSERHLKIAFDDKLGVVGREAGLIICEDPITFDWSAEEREELAATDETRWLTEQFPAGVHMRPEGHGDSQTILVLWAYHLEPHPEVFPTPLDADFSEVAIRGIARLIPGLAAYTTRLPKVYMDGGYYTKTTENRCLIGPLPVDGAYVCGAYSGYGLMAACAGGELLAAHVAGGSLPSYAPAFLLSRYDDPAYRALVASWGSAGQL